MRNVISKPKRRTVLNSSVSDYYFFQITAKIAGGRKRYTKQYVEQIPIPLTTKQEQLPYEQLVDYVILAKSKADDMCVEAKLAIIQSEFERLYDPNHPMRFAIETLDSVEEVRIIKEALK